MLTRQDWRGGTWAANANGHWDIEVATAGAYDIDVRSLAVEDAGTITLSLGDATFNAALAAGSESHSFESVPLSVGPMRLQVTLEVGDVSKGPWQVDARLNSGG